ncbi:MAG: signal recognition particle-docking protein FtsY [Vibrionaceae bacterium]
MAEKKQSGIKGWFGLGRNASDQEKQEHQARLDALAQKELQQEERARQEAKQLLQAQMDEVKRIEEAQQQERSAALAKNADFSQQPGKYSLSALSLQKQAKASVPALAQEKPASDSLFAKLKLGLSKTKMSIGNGILELFLGKSIDAQLFDMLEEQLLIADLGIETTDKIIKNLTEKASRKQLKEASLLYGLLKQEMVNSLAPVEKPLTVDLAKENGPFVILMVGVNGVGKTTTIGKLAKQFQQQGKSVLLAAGDTFRAAAVEQLQVWGKRNNVPVIAQQNGADSASVIFDAIAAAKARQIDVVIADTAGRLQNKANLMNELRKIVRVIQKSDAKAPHEIMLTLDAGTGQNALNQARLFNEIAPISGITLTKLDGTAKGGIIFAIADQMKIPIRYIGIGEGVDDLRPFVAHEFIEALFSQED